MPSPLFCAARGAMHFDAHAVDEQPIGNGFGSGRRAEDASRAPGDH